MCLISTDLFEGDVAVEFRRDVINGVCDIVLLQGEPGPQGVQGPPGPKVI